MKRKPLTKAVLLLTAISAVSLLDVIKKRGGRGMIRSRWIKISFAASLAAAPGIAWANVPLPSLFGFGAPFFLSLTTLGLTFVAIVMLEAAILRLSVGAEWKRCLHVALVANLASSLVGILFASSYGLILIFILPVFIIGHLIRHRIVKIPWAVLFGLLPSVCIFAWYYVTWPHGRGVAGWAFYGSLAPAFVLTVLIEAPIFEWMFQHRHLFKRTLHANLASYLMLVALMFVFQIDPTHNPLLTSTYLWIQANELARQGKPEEAMRLIERMRELVGEDADAYYYTVELRTAKIMAENGAPREARAILDTIKTTPRAPSNWDDQIAEGIKELERLLGDVSTTAGSGPATIQNLP